MRGEPDKCHRAIMALMQSLKKASQDKKIYPSDVIECAQRLVAFILSSETKEEWPNLLDVFSKDAVIGAEIILKNKGLFSGH